MTASRVGTEANIQLGEKFSIVSDSLYMRVSRPPTTDTWGWIILSWGRGGVVLCIVGYLAAYLASTYKMIVSESPPQTMTIKHVSRHCQMSPGGHNGPQLRTSALVL